LGKSAGSPASLCSPLADGAWRPGPGRLRTVKAYTKVQGTPARTTRPHLSRVLGPTATAAENGVRSDLSSRTPEAPFCARGSSLGTLVVVTPRVHGLRERFRALWSPREAGFTRGPKATSLSASRARPFSQGVRDQNAASSYHRLGTPWCLSSPGLARVLSVVWSELGVGLFLLSS
jgi:hypothetical protein